ncbi:ferrous iron transport protein A [Alkalinema sp. FACHB-956]|uniref:ferrous iron transport protein A n=1 Tax=Alkalinema sp. FACHB-956 TaxID=2692768 RepID=UPI0016848B88|nr:ferrous iron transport protein A [Alkalinema sp. FACHB-956]MBD2327929.1 ferrous iron transport protein A [Alkalinema sp. FACHB-956]
MTDLLYPLKQLKVGERAVIAKLHQANDYTHRKLKTLGLTLGKTITLEQNFPRYIIRLGSNRVPLSPELLSVVSVRITNRIS